MTDILISQNAFGCRAAILENGRVCEILYEQGGIVGNIYIGVVVRVISTLKVAFLDIGEKRTAFLPYKAKPPHQGERLIVQVTKEPYGTKGATVSTNIRLSSRYLVYLPQSEPFVSASSSLPKDDKNHLISTVQTLLNAYKVDGGFIVRQHSRNLSLEELLVNMQALSDTWQHILAQKSKSPSCLYLAPSLPYRMTMDMKIDDKILIDNPSLFQALNHFTLSMMPPLAAPISQHSEDIHLFQKYGVYDAQNQALSRIVSLPSGGSLAIDECEAMTVIDVNTDTFVGKSQGDDAILKTNLEAAHAIAHQLRLRNIGGMILIDFINMKKETDYKNLISTFKQELAKDAKTQFISSTKLGLVELTRERTELSMIEKLCIPCAACNGLGIKKSYELLLSQLTDELTKKSKLFQNITIRAGSDFIAYLYAHEIYLAWVESLDCAISYQEMQNLPHDYQILSC